MFFHHNCLFCTSSFIKDIYRFVKRFPLCWSMKVGTLHNHWHGWCLISLSRDICHQYKPSGHLYKRGKITNHPKWFFIIKVTEFSKVKVIFRIWIIIASPQKHFPKHYCSKNLAELLHCKAARKSKARREENEPHTYIPRPTLCRQTEGNDLRSEGWVLW